MHNNETEIQVFHDNQSETPVLIITVTAIQVSHAAETEILASQEAVMKYQFQRQLKTKKPVSFITVTEVLVAHGS